ncbi:XRE family transcriptional regulator [Hydrogenovibrio sp. JE_KL2]|uniref:XRE family transcriptional regulator n=1 Tax=Hydrogenovibrio sp. JE_KL2 TaxID=2651188 RepID=UPI00128E0A50|nr:XRE family transcriptional regulator [Hydrogenovibrio sp. JE_KL2]MPQ75766.1 ImmA/IrrE family metallo-endopeptidase [Hydrogenovibrio sp. JE_KL2]
MSTANINPEILIWARERLGFSVSEFARTLQKPEDRLTQWETGQRALTFKQAITFAHRAHIPFGYLFLEAPPMEELPIPDLRTLDGQGVSRPSAELFDLIKLMLQRQDWYKDYLKQQFAEPNQIVNSFSNRHDVSEIVSDMREKLQVAIHPVRGDWENYYRELVAKIESIGILVMRQADLGHFTRPLQVSEFRGFAIADEYAPMIFINHADAPGARLFTLIHELCHIWIGQSGISNGDPQTHRNEEILCNAVAAEFLVPEAEFIQLWQADLDNWRENLPVLESHFHVSKWALARRALTCHFISHQDYVSYINDEKEAYKNRERSGNGGPNYYRTKKAQISQNFSRAVVSQALNGQVLLREAGQLLGMKPSNISKFAKELQI